MKEFYGINSLAREKAEELIEKDQLGEIINGLDKDRVIRQAAVLRWLKTLEIFHDNTGGKGRPYIPIFEDENGICRIRAYKCFFNSNELDAIVEKVRDKEILYKDSFGTPQKAVEWTKKQSEDQLCYIREMQMSMGGLATSTTLDFDIIKGIDPLGETVALAIDVPIDHIHVFPGGQGVSRVYKPGVMPFNEAELTLFGSPGVLVPFGKESPLASEDVTSKYFVFAANPKFNLGVPSLKQAYETHYLREE